MIRENENILVVETIFRALTEGNVEAALAAFADTPTWRTPPETPLKPLYTGREGMRAYFQDLRRLYPGGLEIVDLTLHADRDRVFAEYRTHGATDRGVRIEEHSLVVFELVYGKVTTAREFNVGGLRAALAGAAPA